MFILKSPMNMVSLRLAYIPSAADAQAGIKSLTLHFLGDRYEAHQEPVISTSLYV